MFESLVALALCATQPAQPPVDRGWELRIESARLAEPVFVGEYCDQIRVVVTLKNVDDKERGYVPFPRNIERAVLEANIKQPDGQLLRRIGDPRIRDDFKNLTPLAAGKEVSFSVTLNRFGFTNFRKPGKHTVQFTYTAPEGRVTSNEIAFAVHDPAKDDVLARHPIPLVGSDANRPAPERPSLYIEQARVGDKTYLLYRKFVGPKYGGVCDMTARLAELPGKVELVAVGAYGNVLGNHKPLFVAYAHAPGGITTLRVESIGGEVEERIVYEPEKSDDIQKGWGLFKDCKFDRREDMPPEKLRLTYEAFAASVKTGGQAKFCLPHSVEVSDAEDPKRSDLAPGMNIPWMKKNFSEKVMGCRKDPDDCFLIRTGTSYLFWVQTRSGEWRIYSYGDKPIR
jgi:hypothetical protein